MKTNRLYDTKHALDGNTRAGGKIRINGDFMNPVPQRSVELPKGVLFHIGANGFRTGRNYGLAGRGFGQWINIPDFGRHDDDFLRRLAHELRHALGGAKLHHVRGSHPLRHLAHAGTRATALGMDHDRGVRIISPLHFHMVWANTVVHMTGAHHQP